MSETNMTDTEVKLADEKLRAEISKLVVESAKISAEIGQVKIQTLLAPFLAAAAVMGATVAVVKVFLS